LWSFAIEKDALLKKVVDIKSGTILLIM
jgi:hypothetical protein